VRSWWWIDLESSPTGGATRPRGQDIVGRSTSIEHAGAYGLHDMMGNLSSPTGRTRAVRRTDSEASRPSAAQLECDGRFGYEGACPGARRCAVNWVARSQKALARQPRSSRTSQGEIGGWRRTCRPAKITSTRRRDKPRGRGVPAQPPAPDLPGRQRHPPRARSCGRRARGPRYSRSDRYPAARAVELAEQRARILGAAAREDLSRNTSPAAR